MRKKLTTIFVALLLSLITLLGISLSAQAASPRLSSTKRSMALDQTYTLTMKYTKRQVTFSSSNPAVVAVKQTGKNKAKLTAT